MNLFSLKCLSLCFGLFLCLCLCFPNINHCNRSQNTIGTNGIIYEVNKASSSIFYNLHGDSSKYWKKQFLKDTNWKFTIRKEMEISKWKFKNTLLYIVLAYPFCLSYKKMLNWMHFKNEFKIRFDGAFEMRIWSLPD